MDKLARLTAEVDVRHLVGHYAHLVDARRLAECEMLFAEDAHMDVMGKAYSGRKEVRGWLDTLDKIGGPAGKHMVCNHVLSFHDGGKITAISDFMVFKDMDGRWASTSRGAYHDEFVYQGDKLLFQKRRIEVLFAKSEAKSA
jgi:hypothetical protein